MVSTMPQSSFIRIAPPVFEFVGTTWLTVLVGVPVSDVTEVDVGVPRIPVKPEIV